MTKFGIYWKEEQFWPGKSLQSCTIGSRQGPRVTRKLCPDPAGVARFLSGRCGDKVREIANSIPLLL